MIYRNGKETVGVFHGTDVIAAVYHGLNLVWRAVRSCFGTGTWLNAKPWINSDNWKNN